MEGRYLLLCLSFQRGDSRNHSQTSFMSFCPESGHVLVPEPITVDYPYTNYVPEGGMVLVSPKAYCLTWRDWKWMLGELSTVAMIQKTIPFFFKIIFVFVHKKS